MRQKSDGIAMRYTEPLSLTYGHTSTMVMCRCGDVFQASGDHTEVWRKLEVWNAEHKHCIEKKREGVKTFWMSFCDNGRPKGQQFLGACLIDVTAEEADEAAIDVLLRFPFAQPDAEWIAAATTKAHLLGCNPGGEIATREIPHDHPMLTHYERGVLMSKATIERIDAEIEQANGK